MLERRAPQTSPQTGPALAGALLFLLGLSGAVGWWLQIVQLVQILPGLAAMAFMTTVCFMLAGLALAAPLWPRRAVLIRGSLGLVIAAVAILHIGQQLSGWQQPVPGAEVQRWFDEGNPHPARMALSTSILFLVCSLLLVLPPVAQRGALNLLGRTALLAVLVTAGIATLAYLLQMEMLYRHYTFDYMALQTALGLIVFGLGLWPLWWGESAVWLPNQQDRGITTTAIVVLICTALGVGITAWVSEQQHLAAALGDGLRLALKSRVEQINTTIELRRTRAALIASRQGLLQTLRAHANGAGGSLEQLQDVLHNYASFGFSAIALYAPDGREIARTGDFTDTGGPALSVVDGDTSLIWRRGFVLRRQLQLTDAKGALGTLLTEQALTNLTTSLADTSNSAYSDELMLCAAQGGGVRCFPNEHSAQQPFTLPENSADRMQLALPALAGRSGVRTVHDFRDRRVVGAYMPLRDFNLIAILKSDTTHLYAPMTRQFGINALLMIAVIGIGTGLIYARVRPLVKALRLSEQRLQLALDASASHVWELDLRNGLLIPGGGLFRRLGLPEDSGPITPEQWRECVHPEDLGEDRDGWSLLREGAGRELRLRDRDGAYHWFSFRGGVVEKDGNGQPLRALGTVTDIAARKRIEQELIAARIAADDANHAKSQFLSSMSHELRTPLNGVLGYVQMLAADPATSSSQQRQLSAIESCGQHLLTLINDVLDLAKIESGNLEVEHSDCNLYDLLESVSDIVRERALNKKLAYTVEIDKAVPTYIRTDAIKLRQILVNLLGNAIKFTHAGSIALKVTTRSGGRELLFQVRDTGIGIPLEKQQEIFKPFRQVNHRSGGGTGLGLSISQRLCEALGGKLLVHSAVGAGSSFSFSLPLEVGEVTRAEPPQRLAHPVIDLRAATLTVMVVDDNPVNRQVLAGMLRASGMDVVEAENGREALEKLRIQFVPLVLMDVRMPVMDGFAATRAIKSNPLLRKAKVIAVSASVFPDTVAAMRAAGCDDFIKKPVRVRELLEKIAQHLQLPLHEQQGVQENQRPG